MNKKENRPETSLSTILVIEDRLMDQGEKFISPSQNIFFLQAWLGIKFKKIAMLFKNMKL